jgi:hypothetical protein
MKLRITLTGLIIISLLNGFTGGTNQRTRSENSTSQKVSPEAERARAQMQRAARMSGTVRRMSNLLTKERVPFEPTILFARNWKSRVRPYLESMPQMWKTQTLPQRFGGAKIANIVYLPDKIELTGDTVILANYVVFASKQVEIVGYNDLLVFPMESVLSENKEELARNGSSVRLIKARYGSEKELLKAKNEGELVAPKSVKITLDGFGRDQFLERERQRKAGLVAHHAAFQNVDKPPGATGDTGERGEPGQTPAQASAGANGSCSGSPHGVVGSTGATASPAQTGKEGKRGLDGDNGGTLIWTMDPAVSWYSFSAKGGRGGQGGQGGPGGFPAIGGQGGEGGLAAVCACPQYSGNGGPGGPGGQGSAGGWGGQGGPGATGGRGGTINLTIPCNYTGNYALDVNRGGMGPGGEPGVGSIGGAGGPGGPGKPGASNASCPDHGGLTGAPGGGGPPGDPGEHGTRGDDGQPGPSDGSFNPTFSGNCGDWGGGGGNGGIPDLEPGTPNQYCTPWYWVSYHCEDYAARLIIKDERNNGAHHASGSGPIAAFVWQCVETGRTYAGCW